MMRRSGMFCEAVWRAKRLMARNARSVWFMPAIGGANGAKHPTVLDIHGGPATHFGDSFFQEFQLRQDAARQPLTLVEAGLETKKLAEDAGEHRQLR